MATRRSFTLEFKQKVIDYAEKHSGESTAKKFGVLASSIRQWKKKKATIVAVSGKDKKSKRVKGAGRKLKLKELDNLLVNWILEQRQKSLRVSRRAIREKAKFLIATLGFGESDLKASPGWLYKFLKRHGFSLRRRTTVAQKDPEQLSQRLVDVIMFTSQAREEHKISLPNIVAMDETSLWFDMLSNSTIDKVGTKSVPLKSTGNEKAHATIVLAARADGWKLEPYIVFKNAKREVQALSGTKGAVVVSSKNGWMNDELTADWVKRIYGKFAFGKRMLIWDSYKCHISDSTKSTLRDFNTVKVTIPGGCTKYVQAPDVSWNKPFKAHLTESYDQWLSGDKDKDYTKGGGNLKAPRKSLLVEWVKLAWASLDEELIKKSFRVCGLVLKDDGSKDGEIHCMKSGQLNHSARALLDTARIMKGISELTIQEDEEETEHNEIVIDGGDSDDDTPEHISGSAHEEPNGSSGDED